MALAGRAISAHTTTGVNSSGNRRILYIARCKSVRSGAAAGIPDKTSDTAGSGSADSGIRHITAGASNAKIGGNAADKAAHGRILRISVGRNGSTEEGAIDKGSSPAFPDLANKASGIITGRIGHIGLGRAVCDGYGLGDFPYETAHAAAFVISCLKLLDLIRPGHVAIRNGR